MSQRSFVVVGGGLAGLCAATKLARAGAAVTLLERSSSVGGRATSRRESGCLLNQGPHALYLGGPAARMLAELGVRWSGTVPGSKYFFAERDGRHFPLPMGALSLLSTGLVGLGGKLEVARVLGTLKERASSPLDGVTVADWLTERVRDPHARSFLEALIRVTTYCADTGRMSAGAALSQMAHATKHGVVYVDGGWQTLVDGALASAEAAGVRVITGAGVRAVEAGPTVVMDDGSRVDAEGAILAVGPHAAAELTRKAMVSRAASEAVPCRAVCLDVALSRLPNPSHHFTLGIDRPTYLSVHTAFAKLAPEGSAVVHVAKYLTGDGDANDRAELEALLDRAQPGWRDVVLYQRFLPKMTVTQTIPLATSRGLHGRAPVVVGDVPGVFLAGDWVGDEGMLLDAALASASRASELALSSRSRQVA